MTRDHEFTAVASAALLAGVTVVEFSRHVAGAYCGKLLALMGAAVTRFGPAIDATGSPDTRQALQQVFHAGKNCAPLDVTRIQAALGAAQIVIVEKDDHDDRFTDCVAQIIEHRTGLNAEAIVVVISANGHDGYVPGCGLTSAASAAMSWGIGEPAREPLTPAYDIVDHEAGASAAAAALVALLSGRGASCSPVDVASRDVVAHFVSMLAQNYLPFGRPWQRDGRRPYMSGGIYPLGLFKCKDGYIALYCRSNHEWKGIVNAMGDPAWSEAERYIAVLALEQAQRINAARHVRSASIALPRPAKGQVVLRQHADAMGNDIA